MTKNLKELLERATTRPWPEGLVVNLDVDMAVARIAVNHFERLVECVEEMRRDLNSREWPVITGVADRLLASLEAAAKGE